MKYENLELATNLCKEIDRCKQMMDNLKIRDAVFIEVRNPSGRHIHTSAVNDKSHKDYIDTLYNHYQDRLLALEEQLKEL